MTDDIPSPQPFVPRAQPGLRRLPIPVQALGESARWYDALGALVFVDIHAPHVGLYDPSRDALRVLSLPEIVGGVHLGRSGRLIVTLRRRIAWLDMATGRLETITAFGEPGLNTRSNDGRCDPWGRLWVPSMPMQPNPDGARGLLYRLDETGRPEPLFGAFEVPNALAFSPDRRWMHYADTPRRTVWRRPLDADGQPGAEAPFVVWPDDVPGRPDGACMDAQGGLWIAMARNGVRVERRMPDGRLSLSVPVPARRPTCPALGGPAGSTLFVTSMSHNLEPAEAPGWQDGAVFAVEVAYRGAPETLVDDTAFVAREG